MMPELSLIGRQNSPLKSLTMESSTHQQQPEQRESVPPVDVDVHSTPQFHSTQEITEFIDEVPKQEALITESAPVPDGQDPFRAQDICSFLSRPRIVHTLQWSSDDLSGSLLLRLSFPDTLFNSGTIWNKIQQFVYLRANLKLCFKTNGSSFHYGQLMIVWRPSPIGRTIRTTTSDPSAYDSIYQVSQYDHVLVSPASAQDIEMKLPYMAPLEKIPLASYASAPSYNNVGRTYSNQGVLEVWVLTPLRASGTGAVPTVTLTIYASFDEPELTGFTHKSLTYVPFNVPLPTSVLMPSNFRYTPQVAQSGPSNEIRSPELPPGAQLPIVFQPAQLSSSHYNQPSYPLTLGESSISDVLPVSLTSQLSEWSLFHTFMVTDKQTPGTSLSSWYNNPHNCKAGTTASKKPALFPTKLSYIAELFSLWRGPIEYRFDFIASKFHSLRVKIAWYPPETTSVSSIMEVPDAWSKIVDVQGQVSTTFTVPHLFASSYIPFDSNAPITSNNGIVNIMVLNQLTYFMTPIPPIQVNVWIRAPNIEFAGFLGLTTPFTCYTNGFADGAYGNRIPMFQEATTRQVAQAKVDRALACSDIDSILHKPCVLGILTANGQLRLSSPFPEILPPKTDTHVVLRMNTVLDYLSVIHLGFTGSLRYSFLNPDSQIFVSPRFASGVYMRKETKQLDSLTSLCYKHRWNASSYFPACINALKDVTLPCYTNFLYRPFFWYTFDTEPEGPFGLSIPMVLMYNTSLEPTPVTLSASSDFSFVGKAPAPIVISVEDARQADAELSLKTTPKSPVLIHNKETKEQSLKGQTVNKPKL